MDFDYPESTVAVRTRVRAFLDDSLPNRWTGIGGLEGEAYTDFVEDSRVQLHKAGLLGAAWPIEYGGSGLTPTDQLVIAEELTKAGTPVGGPNDIFGISMLGNTLLQYGTEDQKTHFLPRILSGEYRFCQGYSEPNAGSDLARVATRAMRGGDEWIIDGQNIWTSAAQTANWIFVLCRTDTDAQTHKGITFILCPIDQPGVDVRPIEMLAGPSEFNEVFFDAATASVDHVVGQVNDGWRVAMALLGFELGEAAGLLPISFRNEFDRLAVLAAHPRCRTRPNGPRPSRTNVCRGGGHALPRVRGHHAFHVGRIASGRRSDHQGVLERVSPSNDGSGHRYILGISGLVASGRPPSSTFGVDDPGAPNSTASRQRTFLTALAGTIYAGTSEIQRNIIGEMLLGLPKEPRVD